MHPRSIETICAICLESIDSAKTMTSTTPCGHTLHFSCALLLHDTALRCRDTTTNDDDPAARGTPCPTCRTALPELGRSLRTVMPDPEQASNETLQFWNAHHGRGITINNNHNNRQSAMVIQCGSTKSDVWRCVPLRHLVMDDEGQPTMQEASSSSSSSGEKDMFFLRHEPTQKYLCPLPRSILTTEEGVPVVNHGGCGRPFHLVPGNLVGGEALWSFRNTNSTTTNSDEKKKKKKQQDRYYLIHAESDLCMEVSAGEKESPVWMWNVDDDPWQAWRVVKTAEDKSSMKK